MIFFWGVGAHPAATTTIISKKMRELRCITCLAFCQSRGGEILGRRRGRCREREKRGFIYTLILAAVVLWWFFFLTALCFIKTGVSRGAGKYSRYGCEKKKKKKKGEREGLKRERQNRGLVMSGAEGSPVRPTGSPQAAEEWSAATERPLFSLCARETGDAPPLGYWVTSAAWGEDNTHTHTRTHMHKQDLTLTLQKQTGTHLPLSLPPHSSWEEQYKQLKWLWDATEEANT